MELMRGTLASKIEQGPSDPDLVRSVLKQTLDALAFLHEKQKVHGTVRPTNLLINDMGRVKLSEFEQTAVGGELRVPTGSKKYLAPELIRPEFGEFGPPTDLYCLGFTALELLKGPQFESLFPGTGKGAIDADIAWLRWHSSPDELASTKKLVKGIPDDLAHVLDRMLKKRVAERAQTAQEVLKELADRPLVPVTVADGSDVAAAMSDRALEPGKVRELAPGQQTVLPPNVGPVPAPPVTAAASSPSPQATRKHVAKAMSPSGKPTPPKYSKDWFNQQLGRPYVLYPLCAAILLGALWFTIKINSGGSVPPIPVTFAVNPDAANLQVAEGEEPLKASPEGAYLLAPGVHKVTFRKEGFHPATKEIDVSAEKNKFAVQLEPIIKWIDVALKVTPPDAELSLDGAVHPLVDGAYMHKQQEGQPLRLEVKRAGFVTVSRSIAAAELAKLGNKVTLELEPEKPQLPESLVAKPGAEIDADTRLPVRATAARLSAQQPLEFALVKPGTYSYGSAEKLREGEVPKRSVEIREPFYIGVNEVTNAQYQEFAGAAGDAKAGTRWQDASKKWSAPLNFDPLKNPLPVTNVSSEQAGAFCAWVGGRLPAEIEWESAVRGSDDRGYPLPWGSAEPSRERCQIFYGELGPVPIEKLFAGASPLGLLNAIGNAAEWCQNSEPGGGYILRGCSFATANIDDVRVTWRRPGGKQGEEDTGFRVVIPVAVPADTAGPVSSVAPESDSDANVTPTLLTPVVVLFSLPWDELSRDLGLAE
jgi:formylglycine-generating enzyme required for sulfatase activity